MSSLFCSPPSQSPYRYLTRFTALRKLLNGCDLLLPAAPLAPALATSSPLTAGMSVTTTVDTVSLVSVQILGQGRLLAKEFVGQLNLEEKQRHL